MLIFLLMSTFIRQKAETQQNYTCTPHTRTHTHTHTVKTVKYTNGYKQQSAKLAKCLSTQHFKRYVLSLLPHR